MLRKRLAVVLATGILSVVTLVGCGDATPTMTTPAQSTGGALNGCATAASASGLATATVPHDSMGAGGATPGVGGGTGGTSSGTSGGAQGSGLNGGAGTNPSAGNAQVPTTGTMAPGSPSPSTTNTACNTPTK